VTSLLVFRRSSRKTTAIPDGDGKSGCSSLLLIRIPFTGVQAAAIDAEIVSAINASASIDP